MLPPRALQGNISGRFPFPRIYYLSREIDSNTKQNDRPLHNVTEGRGIYAAKLAPFP